MSGNREHLQLKVCSVNREKTGKNQAFDSFDFFDFCLWLICLKKATVELMKKSFIRNLMWPVIITTFVAAGTISHLLFVWGPRPGEEKRARNALKRSIASIASGNEVNDLIITTTRWHKLTEFSEDFVSDYNITWHDYTFGAWEFGVEFPEVEKEYYFDLSYYSDISKWRVRLQPVGACLKPLFQMPCLLPEYKQVRSEASSAGPFGMYSTFWSNIVIGEDDIDLAGLSSVHFTYWYEADPNIVVDKDDVRSRIMNALSEDGWQPIPLPEDQNSISNIHEIGSDDLYYSLQPSPDGPIYVVVNRIYISEDAKKIVIYNRKSW